MFDSPMEHCAVCGEMVTLAQTVAECRRSHGCGGEQVCPLGKYFSGTDDFPVRDRGNPREHEPG